MQAIVYEGTGPGTPLCVGSSWRVLVLPTGSQASASVCWYARGWCVCACVCGGVVGVGVACAPRPAPPIKACSPCPRRDAPTCARYDCRLNTARHWHNPHRISLIGRELAASTRGKQALRWGPLASPQLHVLASQTHAFSSKRHAGRTHRRHFSPCTCCSWPISLPATPCRAVNPSARLRRPRGFAGLWRLFTPHDKIPQGAGWPELGSLGSAGQANPRSKQLGAVAATMLRAVSRPMHTAFTHTGWAQQFWRLQSVRNARCPSARAPS